jgi:hypothetical protein
LKVKSPSGQKEIKEIKVTLGNLGNEMRKMQFDILDLENEQFDLQK